MTNDGRNPDELPNGAGDGDTDTDAPDTSSGGSPQEPDKQKSSERPDGTPV